MPGRPVASPGLLVQADALARGAFPAGSTAVLMVLAAVPIGLPGLVPTAALTPVFFWSVFRPATVAPAAVFGLGLLQDLLTAAPLGSGVLVLLVTHALAARWRRALAAGAFPLVWLAFAGFAAGAAGFAWALDAALGWRVPPAAPGLVQAAVGIGVYPAIAAVLTRLHRAMDAAVPA